MIRHTNLHVRDRHLLRSGRGRCFGLRNRQCKRTEKTEREDKPYAGHHGHTSCSELPGCGKTMSARENFGRPQVHLNRRIFPQDAQKGRPARPQASDRLRPYSEMVWMIPTTPLFPTAASVFSG